MKLAIATNNLHKLTEIRDILNGKFDELLSLKDLGIDVEIEETGETFEENALIKAREIVRLTGMPALADDTGLMVDALNGAPGVYSARYAGEQHNDADNRKLLLKNLDGVKARDAHFETCVALCFPDGHYVLASGQVFGEILTEERGEHGFGYDSLFYSPELNKTFAEASEQEKNSVSHRGRALKNLLGKIKTR